MFLKSIKLLQLVHFGKTKQVTEMLLSYQFSQIKILVLLLLVFALVGMNMFGKKMYREYYNEHNNFTNFFQSFFFVTKLSTTEMWSNYMYELTSNEPYNGISCTEYQTWQDYQQNGPRECGDPDTFNYFVQFIHVVCFTSMNLTIALFIDALSKDNDSQNLTVKKHEIQRFRKLWYEYDTDAKGWITLHQLCCLVHELPESFKPAQMWEEDQANKNFDSLYTNKAKENELIAAIWKHSKDDPNKIEVKVAGGERYILHYSKKLCLNERKVMNTLRELELDVYDAQNVHYTDLSSRLIEFAFRRTHEKFKPFNARLSRKVTKKWKRNFKVKIHKDQVKEPIGKALACNVLFRRLMIARAIRKMKANIQNASIRSMKNLSVIQEEEEKEREFSGYSKFTPGKSVMSSHSKFKKSPSINMSSSKSFDSDVQDLSDIQLSIKPQKLEVPEQDKIVRQVTRCSSFKGCVVPSPPAPSRRSKSFSQPSPGLL